MTTTEALLSRRTIVINSGELMTIMMMNTLGLSILYAEFKRAYWHYSKPNWRPQAASDSLAFIQGTGLELMVRAYGLMYNSDNLRNVFFSMVGDHEKIS